MCTRLTHFGAPVEQILCEASEWEWFLPDLGEYRATQVRHQRWLLRQHRLLCSAEERDWYPFWMLWWNRYTWRTPGRKAWWTGRRASSSWTRYWGTLWKCWYLQWQSCRRHPSTKCQWMRTDDVVEFRIEIFLLDKVDGEVFGVILPKLPFTHPVPPAKVLTKLRIPRREPRFSQNPMLLHLSISRNFARFISSQFWSASK